MIFEKLVAYSQQIKSRNRIIPKKSPIARIYALVISAKEYHVLMKDTNYIKTIYPLLYVFDKENELDPYYAKMPLFKGIHLYMKNPFDEEKDRFMSEDRYKEIKEFISYRDSIVEKINEQKLFHTNPAEFQRVCSFLDQVEDRVINQNLDNHLINNL